MMTDSLCGSRLFFSFQGTLSLVDTFEKNPHFSTVPFQTVSSPCPNMWRGAYNYLTRARAPLCGRLFDSMEYNSSGASKHVFINCCGCTHTTNRYLYFHVHTQLLAFQSNIRARLIMIIKTKIQLFVFPPHSMIYVVSRCLYRLGLRESVQMRGGYRKEGALRVDKISVASTKESWKLFT